jgi:DNA-binding NarL/FixJ family response regulator
MISPNAQVHVFEPAPVSSRTLPSPLARIVDPPDTQETLRAAARKADAQATTHISASQLWRDLARGATRIVDGFFSEERCYLVLTPKREADTAALEGRRLDILETVLSGLPQKNVAYSRVLAPSTVALNARLGLESLGVHCKPSRAHPLLMLAARAGTESKLMSPSCTTFTSPSGRELCVISVPRPDLGLSPLLPPAELAVIRSLIEGLPYKEIAARRGTSTRTIANQITAVFRRLHVSGRNELVHRLFFETPSGAPVRANAETLAPPGAAPVMHSALRSA